MDKTYYSSLSLSKMSEMGADAAATKNRLVEQLRERGVDATGALESGTNSDHETIVRLVSLARAHGLAVVMEKHVAGQPLGLRVVAPSAAGMLQSGHHEDQGDHGGGGGGGNG